MRYLITLPTLSIYSTIFYEFTAFICLLLFACLPLLTSLYIPPNLFAYLHAYVLTLHAYVIT